MKNALITLSLVALLVVAAAGQSADLYPFEGAVRDSNGDFIPGARVISSELRDGERPGRLRI